MIPIAERDQRRRTRHALSRHFLFNLRPAPPPSFPTTSVTLPRGNPSCSRFLGNFLGKHGRALERFDEAELALLESHGIRVAALSNDHEQTTRVVGYLADLYDAWTKPEKAAGWRAKVPTEQDAVTSDPPADEKQGE